MAEGFYLDGEYTRDVWSIKLDNFARLAGIGMFGWPTSDFAHLRGCRIALFDTRREAREHLLSVKTWRPKAKVVPITLTVKIRDA